MSFQLEKPPDFSGGSLFDGGFEKLGRAALDPTHL
jgi:hypothetical protein